MDQEKTTSQIILETARTLLQENGSKGFTMRKIAKGSQIALGTIYNYYATKDEIILALVEEFWAAAMLQLDDIIAKEYGFLQELEEIYDSLFLEFSRFQSDWIQLLQKIDPPQKQEGRDSERRIMEGLCQKLSQRLEDYYPEPWEFLEKPEFSAFLCDNLISSLIHQQKEIPTLLKITELVIQHHTL